jgi:hypothetical protein
MFSTQTPYTNSLTYTIQKSGPFQDLGVPLLLYSEQTKCINNQCISFKRGSTKLPGDAEIPTLSDEMFEKLFSSVSKKSKNTTRRNRRR